MSQPAAGAAMLLISHLVSQRQMKMPKGFLLEKEEKGMLDRRDRGEQLLQRQRALQKALLPHPCLDAFAPCCRSLCPAQAPGQALLRSSYSKGLQITV